MVPLLFISFHFGGSPALCPDPLVISAALQHRAWISQSFNSSPASCTDSLVILTALRHRARIPQSFSGSPASCLDLLVISTVIRHRARIPLSFRWLSSIVPGSSSQFGGSPALCLDPLVIRWLSGIMPESSSHFGGSPASCPDPLVIQRLFGIVPGSPSHSGGSSALCLNPLFSGIVPGSPSHSAALRHCARILQSFWWLFGIVPESPIFWHHVRFSFIFPGIAPRFPLFSSTSCPDPLVFPAALRYRARIPYFSASCPVSFYLSRHRAWISFVFSDIALGCYISSGIVSGFLLSFPASRLDFLYFL